MRTADVSHTEVELGDGIPRAAVDHARAKMGELARLAPHPLRRVHVRLARATRSAHSPVLAHVTLDVDGTPLVSHAVGLTASETVDLVQAKLRGQLSRMPRRGGRAQRARDRRQCVRRTHTRLASPTSPVLAVGELAGLGYHFGLFTETATRQDSVVWQDLDGEYRMAQLNPRPDLVGRSELDIAVEPAPAPVMSDADAVVRLDRTQAPFVFFRDRDTDRGRVLYRRADGGYGLLSP